MNNLLELTEKIAQWGADKGLNDADKQRLKLKEEIGELAGAILRNDREKIIDALGDCFVVLTQLYRIRGIDLNHLDPVKEKIPPSKWKDKVIHINAIADLLDTVQIHENTLGLFVIAQHFGIDMLTAISGVYDIISKRTGKTEDGAFIQTKDLK